MQREEEEKRAVIVSQVTHDVHDCSVIDHLSSNVRCKSRHFILTCFTLMQRERRKRERERKKTSIEETQPTLITTLTLFLTGKDAIVG